MPYRSREALEADISYYSARTMPSVVGCAIALSVGMGAFNFTGGLIQGYKSRSEVDEYERREQLKKRQRRPIQETINEIGEGRGMLHEPCYDSSPY